MKHNRLYTKQILVLACIVVAAAMVAGCDSFTSNAYKTLYLTGQAYDVGMSSVADLQRQGAISGEQRAKINEQAGKFYASYQAAATALSIYSKTEAQTDRLKLVTALTETTQHWRTFAEAVNAFKPGTIPLEVK